ncbi:MAG: ligand-binding sensor domain-containing protein, partial [Cyclonatronaceae bacterium]
MSAIIAFTLLLLQFPSGFAGINTQSRQGITGAEEAPPSAASYFIDPDRLISEKWGMEDGLPVNSIIDIEQDHHGFLWLTTYDGLVRFDGHSFTNYNSRTHPEIPANRFRHIYHDKENNDLWFSIEYGGVLRFRQGSFTFFGEEAGLENSAAQAIRPFRWQGELLFPTQNAIYAFDENEQRFNPLPLSDLPFNFLHNVVAGTDGRLYVHTDTHFFSYDESFEATEYMLGDELFQGSNLHFFNDEIFFTHNSGVYRGTSGGQLEALELDSRHRVFNGISSQADKLFITSYEGLSVLDSRK